MSLTSMYNDIYSCSSSLFDLIVIFLRKLTSSGKLTVIFHQYVDNMDDIDSSFVLRDVYRPIYYIISIDLITKCLTSIC